MTQPIPGTARIRQERARAHRFSLPAWPVSSSDSGSSASKSHGDTAGVGWRTQGWNVPALDRMENGETRL